MLFRSAGILLERHGNAVLVGIGINVTQAEFPVELTATSIALHHGRTDRDALMAAVLSGLMLWRDRLQRAGFAPVRSRWLELASTIGRHVSVDSVSGIARGLDEDGALIVERAEGTARILAGDVTEVRVGE